ncbi:MAG TPA: hypothetical protein VMI33_03065 [Streptosporangiaceae bacterium]|nr:hypothetical protein [Streptosporangiaceae bacterium]
MSSATAAATGTGSPRPEQPADGAPARLARALGWASAIGIGSSILIMIVASAVQHSAAVPPPPWSSGPPLLAVPGHLPVAATYAALWAAVVLGVGGVIAGLAALRRGARFPARLLLVAALIVIAIFAVLPPAGSTDALSYATFGRIAALGHNPYVMTPNQLQKTGDPVGRLAILLWRHRGSFYGPLATAEERAAAGLGGASAQQIVFWLKLWNAIVFAAVAIGLDRMLRSDPARRARAHLLWSLNPLVLWGIVAGAHLEGLATAAGFFGLAMLRTRRSPGQPEPAGPGLLAALAAGALVGVAADFLLYYLILGLALVWALRRSAAALVTAVGAMAVVAGLPYLSLGSPSLDALFTREGKASPDNFYQLFSTSLRNHLPHGLGLLVVLLCAALAVLLLRRLPDAVPELPAIQPALALGVGWLFLWYYELPWYDVLVIALLALYPASRLDYVLMVQLGACQLAQMPGGTPFQPPLGWLRTFSHVIWFTWTPLVLACCVLAVILLCVSGAWDIGPPLAARAASAPETPALG